MYVEGPLESKEEKRPPLELAFALLKSIVAASAVEDVGNYWCLNTNEGPSSGRTVRARFPPAPSTRDSIWRALCERGMVATLVSFLALMGVSSPYFIPLARIITQCMRFAYLSDASTFSAKQLGDLQNVAQHIQSFALPVCFQLEECNKNLLTSYGFYGTQLQALYELVSSAENVLLDKESKDGCEDRVDIVNNDEDNIDLHLATTMVQSWPAPGVDEAMHSIFAILLQHTNGEPSLVCELYASVTLFSSSPHLSFQPTSFPVLPP